MAETLTALNPDQLLIACGVMESTMLFFINHCERQGIDANVLRLALDDAHSAVDGLYAEGSTL